MPKSLRQPARAAPAVMVGRRQELGCLQQAFEQSLDRRATIAVVRGPSGIGKSTLLEHFRAASVASTAAVVLSGRCYERESVRFQGWDSVMDALAGYLRQLEPEICDELIPRDIALASRIFTTLQQVPAIARAPVREIADGDEQRRLAFVALGALLARIRSRHPLVIQIDDLQWIDRDGVSLIDALWSGGDGPPLMLVLAFRSEALGQNRILGELLSMLRELRGVSVEEHELGPLSPSSAQDLARVWLPSTDHARAAHIALEAKHVPFHISYLARTYDRVRSVEGARPGTLTESLARDIAGLPDLERLLLSFVALAVGPLDVGSALLAADVKEAGPKAIDRLIEKFWIRRKDGENVDRVECFHDRVREVTLQAMSRREVVQRHARLAYAFMASDSVDPELLAIHLEGAEQRRDAADFYRRAAERAAEGLAFTHASELYAAALRLGDFDTDLQVELMTRRADNLEWAGFARESADMLLSAAKLTHGTSAMVLRKRAGLRLIRSGHYARGIDLLQPVLTRYRLGTGRSRALTMLSVIGRLVYMKLRGDGYTAQSQSQLDAERLAQLDLAYLLSITFAPFENLLAIEYMVRYYQWAIELGEPGRVGVAFVLRQLAQVSAGFLNERLTGELERAKSLADASESPEMRATVLAWSGCVLVFSNQFRRAQEPLLEARRLLQESGYDANLEATGVTFCINTALAYSGKLKQLHVSWSEASQIAHNGDDVLRYINNCRQCAYTLLARNDIAGMQQYLQVYRSVFPSGSFQIRNILLQSELMFDRYCGRDALQRLGAPAAEKFVSRNQVPQMLNDALLMAAGCWAEAARDPDCGASERRRALKRARSYVKRLNWYPGVRALASAAIAWARGDLARVESLLRLGIDELATSDYVLMLRCAEIMLGEVVGGQEYRNLARSAQADLREQGVVEPVRYAHMILPGFRPIEHQVRTR